MLPYWVYCDRLCRGLDDPGLEQMHCSCFLRLPGCDNALFLRCYDTITEIAEKTRCQTVRHFQKFERHPEHFYHSEGYFRSLTLVTTVRKHFGIQYNPEKISEEVPFDVEDTFIHGALFGKGGTCATLPVLYVCVGRRLGYPMRLVAAKGRRYNHLFVRWEHVDGHFNIEATGVGLFCPDDDYYRQGKYALTPEEEQWGGFLQAMGAKRVMAAFLVERSWCFRELGNFREAAAALAWAWALAPENVLIRDTFRTVYNEWTREVKERMPPRFPPVSVRSSERRYPATLPWEHEADIRALEAIEHVLDDPQHRARWWEPLSRGYLPPLWPQGMDVVIGPDAWVSAQGLRYFGRDPQGLNRVAHVLLHGADVPARAGTHGVFDAGRRALSVVDEAWALARAAGPAGNRAVQVAQQGARTVYTIDMGRRVGYAGGVAGNAAGRQALNRIQMVVQNGNELVTAFPIR